MSKRVEASVMRATSFRDLDRFGWVYYYEKYPVQSLRLLRGLRKSHAPLGDMRIELKILLQIHDEQELINAAAKVSAIRL
jgi:hypothetical protein